MLIALNDDSQLRNREEGKLELLPKGCRTGQLNYVSEVKLNAILQLQKAVSDI